MKMTLLQMVTSIMSDMDSDAITSINDTPESLQVASVIQDVYYQLISNAIVPELEQLLQLTTVGVAHPNYLQIPVNVQRFDYIKYNKKKVGDTDDAFSEVCFIEPKDFVDLTMQRKSSSSNMVYLTDPASNIALLIENDKPPQYYTTFDDVYIAFDSYDAGIDTTGLVGTKSVAWGQITPTWTVADGFTPIFDDSQFPLLLAEAKATCFTTIKQTNNPKIEKQARTQKVMTVNDRARAKQADRPFGPNFGRHGRGAWSISGSTGIPYGYKD